MLGKRGRKIRKRVMCAFRFMGAGLIRDQTASVVLDQKFGHHINVITAPCT
jgi:hypothetical protein